MGSLSPGTTRPPHRCHRIEAERASEANPKTKKPLFLEPKRSVPAATPRTLPATAVQGSPLISCRRLRIEQESWRLDVRPRPSFATTTMTHPEEEWPFPQETRKTRLLHRRQRNHDLLN